MAFENFSRIRRDVRVIRAATDAGLNESELRQRCRDEAAGLGTWAPRCPGARRQCGRSSFAG